MSDEEKGKSDWPAILFLLVGLPIAFTYGGVWVGLIVLVIGVVALGWSRRHEGPLPTNRGAQTNEEVQRPQPQKAAQGGQMETRDLSPELITALVNQTIGGQSVMYRMFTEALRCDAATIRRIELTYFAAAVMTYVFLRFGRQPNKEEILDEFTRKVLEKSLPASREQLPFGTAVKEYQQRFAEYGGLLNLLFTPEKSTSGNPAASLLMHAFQSVTGDTARGHMIVITAASGLVQEFVLDHIDFVKKKL